MKKFALVSVLLVVIMTMTSCLSFLDSLLDDNTSTNTKTNNTTQTEKVANDNNNKKTVNITIEISKNLLFSRYDVEFVFNGEKVDTIKHGKSKTFTYDLESGNYTLFFRNAKDNSIYTSISMTVDSDMDAEYNIKCESNKLTVKPIKFDLKRDLKTDEIKIDFCELDLISADVSNVKSQLMGKGFTNVNTVSQYDVDKSSYYYHDVISVKINGKHDYGNGSIFRKNDAVEILFHDSKPVETTPVTTSESTKPSETSTSSSGHRISYHSSQDRDIAKQGNSGIYAYRNRGGSNYKYYVIDFDNGYVYFFSNDESSAMAARIVSGDLNSYILLKYKDSGIIWEEALCFKYKYSPEILILQDNDGFSWEFYTENVNEAVRILNTKTIIDYSPK